MLLLTLADLAELDLNINDLRRCIFKLKSSGGIAAEVFYEQDFIQSTPDHYIMNCQTTQGFTCHRI